MEYTSLGLQIPTTPQSPKYVQGNEFKRKKNMSSSKLSLKLLIHKPSQKILFGEADKKFIDFLFTILALPIGTICNLLLSTKSKTMAGPLTNLYHSVRNLNANHFQENYHKNIDFLLKPRVQIPPSHISSISQILPIESSLPLGYYTCANSSCWYYYATAIGVQCPQCSTTTKYSIRLIPSSSKDELMREWMMLEKSVGFVKDVASYIVMDDLTVTPMSAMSSISMLAELGVDDVTSIQEKLVYLDAKQDLDLLRASICCSSTVLSDVFLHNIDFENSNSIVEEQKVVVSASNNFNNLI